MKSPVIVGIGGAVIGLVAGVMIGKSSIESKLTTAMQRVIAPVTESTNAHSSAMDALSARIDAMEAALAKGAGASADLAGSVGTQIEALKDSLAGTISDKADEQAEALKSAVAGVSEKIAAQAEAFAQVAKPSDSPAPAAKASAPETSPVPKQMPQGGNALSVGETGMFADGAVRAFVQRVGSDSAVLSINGRPSTITAGGTVVVRYAGGTCRVGVGQVFEAGVALTSDCDSPAAPDTGVLASPGGTVQLADNALRVFVSGVVNGDARLAINGLATTVVAVGESTSSVVDGKTCSVTVTGIRGGSVGLTGSCE